MEKVLLLLLGFSTAFPAAGVPLNEQYTLPVVAIVGLFWAATRTLREGLGAGHAWAAILLCAFAATSVFRHPVLSYGLSLGALLLAILPLTVRPRGQVQVDALLLGFKMGLVLTLFIAFMQIFLQLLPGRLPLQDILGEHLTKIQGDFLGYNRPAAGFAEPSHLAIYLCACFALQDHLPAPSGSRAWWKIALGLAIILSGSLSGVAILVAYLAAGMVATLFRRRVRAPGSRTAMAWMAGLCITAILAVVLQDSLAEATQAYVDRILTAQQDIALDNLMSSEGSRLFAYLALIDYWDTSGLTGVLFGTGYGNYREFLAQMYGNLSQTTSFGRGDIDNMLVAVLLSTGLFGGLVYTAYTLRQLRGIPAQAKASLIVLLLAINFSYGFLIAPLYWNLLFVLSTCAVLAAHVRPLRSPRPSDRSAPRTTGAHASKPERPDPVSGN
jgi:hypothetical protein